MERPIPGLFSFVIRAHPRNPWHLVRCPKMREPLRVAVSAEWSSLKKIARERRSFRWIAEFKQDIRNGARAVLREKAFCFAMIAVLAVGIGTADYTD